MEGDRVEDSLNDPLSLIEAFVELVSFQPDVSNGINFLVNITNPGSEPVELLICKFDMRLDNPIIVYLYNAQGIRVDVPDPNWVYLDSLRIQEARKPEYAGGPIRRDVPFRLMESAEDQGPGRVKSLRDVNAKKVTLGPGEHFQLRGRIEEVLADPELWWPLEPQKELPARLPRVIPISSGMYFLKIAVWLRTDEERARLVSSNGLLVELGPK